MIFMGDAFIVTVRHGEGRALKDVRHRLELEREVLDCGPSAVLYAVCDRVVDDYTDIAFEVEEDIEEVEQRVFAPGRSNDAERIYNLKREVIEFHRAVWPLLGPLEAFVRGAYPRLSEELRPYFRDIYDHARRVDEQVTSQRELLTSVLEANLALVSVNQNEVVKRISSYAAIIAVPTFIASVYGMNFEDMPELHWALGYPLCLGVMALSVVLIWRGLRRAGWL
jgi:magnesium transporter